MSNNRRKNGKQRAAGFITGLIAFSIITELPLGPIGVFLGLAVATGIGKGVTELLGSKGIFDTVSDATSEAVQQIFGGRTRNADPTDRIRDTLDMRNDQRNSGFQPTAEQLARAEALRQEQEARNEEIRRQQEARNEEIRRQQQAAARAQQERERQEAARRAKEEQARREEEMLPLSGNENADKVIREGRDLLRQVRAANAAIPEEKLTAQMSQLEYICTQMFRTVSEKPNKANDLRKFMSYYLPTTLKMLNNYKTMRERGVSQNDLDNARVTMEHGMDMILTAAQKQLDSLYKSDMLDVSTDIDVLEQMLKRDGFVDGGLGNIPVDDTPAQSKAASPNASAAASRMGCSTIPTIQVESTEDNTEAYREYYQKKYNNK